MNKFDFPHISAPTREKFTHFRDFGAKTLTGLALFSVLNACGPEKKVDDNLQNEEEKDKIEVVLDSNDNKMMGNSSNKGNIDNNQDSNESFPITKDFETLMGDYIYPQWKKGAEKYSRYAGIEKKGDIEILSFPIDLKNSDNKNVATEIVMYVTKKMIIINEINSLGKIISDLRYQSGINENGEKGVSMLQNNKPNRFYAMTEFHNEGIKTPQNFFNKFIEISKELYFISSDLNTIKGDFTNTP
ncbi:hypothetical protein AGMMS50249_5030 [candidate division SR1 bacterium]|nr:hypothetical protein AGMMS50249_5030 [candidate division SR1 bacterium]